MSDWADDDIRERFQTAVDAQRARAAGECFCEPESGITCSPCRYREQIDGLRREIARLCEAQYDIHTALREARAQGWREACEEAVHVVDEHLWGTDDIVRENVARGIEAVRALAARGPKP